MNSNLIKTITNSASLGVSTNLTVGGDVNIEGMLNSLQSYDNLTSLFYNTTLALTMNTNGMVYYIAGGTPTSVTNLTISTIPITTGLASYVFTLLFYTSSPYYYTSGASTLSIAMSNAYATSITPITPGGSVNLPSSYTYIMQTITVINKTGGSSPTFIAFNNVQGF